MEIFTQVLAEELLEQNNATDEEKDFVLSGVEKTGNAWDAPILLNIFRAMAENGIKE